MHSSHWTTCPTQRSDATRRMRGGGLRILALLLVAVVALVVLGVAARAASLNHPDVKVDVGTGGTAAGGQNTTFQILAMLTVLSLAPSILIMLTGFTRIVIVLSFLRNAIGAQQIPPNQVLIGLALFLTLFVMSPVISEVNKTAYEPFQKGLLTQDEFVTRALRPVHHFMLAQTRKQDVALFIELSHAAKPSPQEDIPMYVLAPAFAISELKTAFQMAFAIFLPFLIIDMVVASTLMSMGMMMLPPAMISLPFKVLLFILVNGWEVMVKSLVLSFREGVIVGRRRRVVGKMTSWATDLAREALFVTFKLCAPVLLLGLIVGVAVSIVQAATQIQEASLSFIPKLIAVGVALLVFGSWMLRVLVDFSLKILGNLDALVR